MKNDLIQTTSYTVYIVQYSDRIKKLPYKTDTIKRTTDPFPWLKATVSKQFMD
jgi:hypothetical protein